jgi:single-stranded-DNA-specific exonuclease
VAPGDLSFGVAPRLNAAGRLDDMSVGIECLLAEDDFSARRIASTLDGLNRDRQQIELSMQGDALRSLESTLAALGDSLPSSVCLYEPGWHQGVVGILASRIKDRVHRPTIAFADGDNGFLKGSARSIPGLHIRDVLDRVATLHPGLVEKFGGHAMAAGLSLAREGLDAFRDALESVVSELLDEVELEAVVETDGELSDAELNLSLAMELRYAAPWGQHFPEPLFDGEFRLEHQRLVGGKHLKLVCSPVGQARQAVDAIAFNVDLDRWPDEAVETAHLAYRLDCNYYRGEERLQLVVEAIEAL